MRIYKEAYVRSNVFANTVEYILIPAAFICVLENSL